MERRVKRGVKYHVCMQRLETPPPSVSWGTMMGFIACGQPFKILLAAAPPAAWEGGPWQILN